MRSSFSIPWVLLVLLAITGCDKKRKTDWRPSFDITSKEPFGLYILSKELKNYDGIQEVKFWKKEIYGHLRKEILNEDTSINQTSILAIHPKMIWDYNSNWMIDEYVKIGNTAIIAAIDLPDFFLDSLGIKIVKYLPKTKQTATSTKIQLCNSLRSDYKKICVESNIGITGSYFYDFDKDSYSVLGEVKYEGDILQPNIVSVHRGSGRFVLVAEPMIFTNYFMLNDSLRPYTESVLSLIPKDTKVFWKVGEILGKSHDPSILSFILSHQPLKIAFYLLLTALLIFVFFTAKRRQRIVPIQEKNTNTTLDFVRTLGNLYLQSNDFNFIVQNKIKFALYKVRIELHISTDTLNEVFVDKLAYKTQKDISKVNHLIQLIHQYAHSSKECDENDVIKISKAIEAVLD
ncbi:MAG: hypothetical protein R2774_13365 [Saprospiraceae bacterium]